MTWQAEAKALSNASLRLAVISDAAPGRNGVGAYYQDLIGQLAPHMQALRIFSPRLVEGRWDSAMALPLPGDTTQKLCLPNPFRLARELREFDPHLIIVATPGAYGLLGAFVAQRLRRPLLVGFHTAFEQLTQLYWQDSWRGQAVYKIFQWSHQYLFRRAQSVLANSREMLDLAQRMGARHSRLIGTPLSRDFALAPVVGYQGDLNKVLFAGRLAAEKNLDAVLEAAQSLPDWQFSIAGDGPLRARMDEAAERLPNLRVLGWLNREQLRDEVDAHHALLLPSHFESFGTIALEVMARCRLVVVSRGCGIADWPSLREGLNVIEPGARASEVLRELAGLSPTQRVERAHRARDLAMSLNNHCIEHWQQLLHSSLGAARDLPRFDPMALPPGPSD